MLGEAKDLFEGLMAIAAEIVIYGHGVLPCLDY
jgi:hypothetical protein